MATPNLRDIQLASSLFLECAILNDEKDPLTQLDTLRFRLNQQINPAFSEDSDEVLIDLAIQCQPMDEKTDQPLPVQARFRLHLVFKVLDLAAYAEDYPDGTRAPGQEFILSLISVAYSTARGLIAAKTADTVLKGFVLPLFDVRGLTRPTT